MVPVLAAEDLTVTKVLAGAGPKDVEVVRGAAERAASGWILFASAMSCACWSSRSASDLVPQFARDMDHEVIWSKPFEGPLDDFDPSTEGQHSGLRRLAAIGDFRGTGHNDVILARSSDRDRRMYWFDHAGTWFEHYRADPRVTFGREHLTSIRLQTVHACRPRRFPRAFDRRPRTGGNFPAVLQALGPSGDVRSEYWSAGFAYRRNGRRSARRTAAAWLSWAARPTRPAAARSPYSTGTRRALSPAADPAYRCTGCPAGTPLHYLVFPRSRLQTELEQIRSSRGDPRCAGRDDPNPSHPGRRPPCWWNSRVGVLHPEFRVQNRRRRVRH